MLAIAAVAYAAATITVAATGRIPGDYRILAFSRDHLHGHTLQVIASRISNLAIAAVGVGLVGAAWVAVSRQGLARRRALLLIAAVLGSLAIKWITKEAVWRPATGFQGTPDEYPSGHATTTLALALEAVLLLPRWRRWPIAVAALAVLLVGLSRIVLGVHYASDVFAGWLLAAAVVAALELLSLRRRVSAP